MAGIKDLASVKLIGSILKKGKDKLTTLLVDDLPKKEPYEEEIQVQKKEPSIEVVKPSTKVDELKPEVEKEIKADEKALQEELPKKEVVETKIKTETKKSPPAKKEGPGAKRAAKIKLYTKDVKKHYGSVDVEFLEIIVKNLGPSIYRRDAESVSCGDIKELDTVRKNFLIKKLGFDKSEKEMLDSEIQKVCEAMKGTRTKYRATFYYILAKNLKKESALS